MSDGEKSVTFPARTPDFPTKRVVAVVATMLLTLVTCVVLLAQFNGWVTRDVRDQQNSIEPVRLNQLETSQGAVVDGEGTVEVEELGRRRQKRPIPIEQAFELLERNPARYGVHEAQ